MKLLKHTPKFYVYKYMHTYTHIYIHIYDLYLYLQHKLIHITYRGEREKTG